MRFMLCLCVALCWIALANCHAPTAANYPAGVTTSSSLDVGERRSFFVHVPPSYTGDQPTPVVLVFHGGVGSGRQVQNATLMNDVADREGFIAVYPNGTSRTWNAGNCCGGAQRNEVDDVGFVRALLDHLEDRLNVDKRRVFATGMSNGAMLSHRLACELSDRIAAVAPVAGTIGVTTCQPTRPVAVMQIHGTADGHVPWQGGVGCGPSGATMTSIDDTMNGWATRNGCADTERELLTQGDGTCTIKDGCGAAVALCAIDGGGHSWPGGAEKDPVINCQGDGHQSTTFIANDIAWRFFVDNPMPE